MGHVAEVEGVKVLCVRSMNTFSYIGKLEMHYCRCALSVLWLHYISAGLHRLLALNV